MALGYVGEESKKQGKRATLFWEHLEGKRSKRE